MAKDVYLGEAPSLVATTKFLSSTAAFQGRDAHA